MKKLIEIHALQNFAPSNLNRDDTGSPKDAIFGGTRRARISSQCSKRAIRDYFQNSIAKGVISENDVAVRTKRLLEHVSSKLVEQGRSLEDAKNIVKSALALIKLKTVKDKKTNEEKTEYLLYLGQREIMRFVEIIQEHWEELSIIAETTDSKEDNTKTKKAKPQKDKAQGQLAKSLLEILNGGKAIDLALFGRMLANMPEKNQNAACQVAHSISTHAVEREFDFFTAVDDLRPEDSAGSGMMGTVEFNSACFYRYAVIDFEALVKNMQGDRDLSVQGLRLFLEGFIVSEPSGKQNTFAAHNPPEFVMVSVREDASPMSLANAFENPVRSNCGEGFTKPSAARLVEKAESLKKAYDNAKSDKTFILNLASAPKVSGSVEETSLANLLDAVVSAVGE